MNQQATPQARSFSKAIEAIEQLLLPHVAKRTHGRITFEVEVSDGRFQNVKAHEIRNIKISAE